MYPSSVVMNVVPAQVAGVESLAVASPPQKETAACRRPAILAACALLGVDEVYAVGRRPGHRDVRVRGAGSARRST